MAETCWKASWAIFPLAHAYPLSSSQGTGLHGRQWRTWGGWAGLSQSGQALPDVLCQDWGSECDLGTADRDGANTSPFPASVTKVGCGEGIDMAAALAWNASPTPFVCPVSSYTQVWLFWETVCALGPSVHLSTGTHAAQASKIKG